VLVLHQGVVHDVAPRFRGVIAWGAIALHRLLALRAKGIPHKRAVVTPGLLPAFQRGRERERERDVFVERERERWSEGGGAGRRGPIGHTGTIHRSGYDVKGTEKRLK